MSTTADEPPTPERADDVLEDPPSKIGMFPVRYVVALVVASSVAALLAIPYEIELKRINSTPEGTLVWVPKEFSLRIEHGEEAATEVWDLPQLAATVVSDTLVSLLAVLLASRLGQRVNLGWPPIHGYVADHSSRRVILETVLLSVAFGAVAGTLLWLRDWIPGGEAEIQRLVEPQWWLGLLVSFAAGVREEIWLRLGVVTFSVWLLTKLTPPRTRNETLVWCGIIVASVLFGLMHLSKTAHLHELTAAVTSVVGVNAVLGVIFGWFYWRKGLLAAMTAHISQEILTHVLFPLFSAA